MQRPRAESVQEQRLLLLLPPGVYLDNALWPLKYGWNYVLLTVVDLIPSVFYDYRLLYANFY